jgi:sporulation protein YlmC with PRC-barrel domain
LLATVERREWQGSSLFSVSVRITPSFDTSTGSSAYAESTIHHQEFFMASTSNPTGAASGRTTPAGADIVGVDRSRADGPGPEVMDADTLNGDSVVNSAGDSLGKIEAIMLDVTAGRIAYAVLSFGGFLGMGSKLFAIPWSALTLDVDEKRFILDVAKERLEDAPGFDKDHWPSMADPTWARDIHTYYNVSPYWEDVRASRDARLSTPSSNPNVS